MKELRRVLSGWFGHIERRNNDKIVKRVYVGECGGNTLGTRRFIPCKKKERFECWVSPKDGVR